MISAENGLARLLRSAQGHALWKTLGVYLVTSWVALQVVDFLAQNFGMPDWFPAFAVALLVIGLPIVLATAIVQSGPPPAMEGDGRGGEHPAAAGSDVGASGPAAPSAASGDGPEPRHARAQAPGGTGTPSRGADASVPASSTVQRLFTWRNAILGGMAAFALWGVVAAVWLLGGGPSDGDAGEAGNDETLRRTVAVLPFDNLSADADNAFFADGIHEDVLTHLSRIEDLTVISRTSVLAYRGATQNLSAIGEELRAGSIVEGSVRRSGDNVRITAQLIDARTDQHLWADNFDRALTAANVFSIQTEIAQRIAAALAATLSPEEERQLGRTPTANLEAYDFVLRGREAYRRYEEDANNEAIRLFHGALERDPEYAEAWAGIADAYGQRVFRYGYGLAWADSAEAAARRALELDPALASGHKALALSLSARGHFQRSIEANLRALELDPNYADPMNNLAVDFASTGRLAEAHRWYRRSFRLQPNVAFVRANLAASYAFLGEYAIARRRLEEAITLDPSDVTPRAYLVTVSFRDGRLDEAANGAEALVRDHPDMPFVLNPAALAFLVARRWQRARDVAARSLAVSPDQDLTSEHHPRDILALAVARTGGTVEGHARLRESAEAYLQDLERTRELNEIPFQLAAIHAELDEWDDGRVWLESAYDGGFRDVALLEYSPFFDAVRDDPGFLDVLDRVRRDVEEMRSEVERDERAAGNR